MPANIAEEISAEKVVALEGSESDLEKLDESEGSESEGSENEGSEKLEESALEGGALEGGALEEGALEEGTLEEGALEEGANVGKSDEQVEQVNKSAEVYCCYSCSNLRRRRALCQRL